MLNFSLSSVIMAVLTSNLLIVILSVIFLNRSILYKFGLPLLGIFGVLITLRMLMPGGGWDSHAGRRGGGFRAHSEGAS